MNVCVIIPAAGNGTRFGTQIPKQFVELQSKPIIIHTLQIFEINPLISSIVLCLSSEWIGFVESLISSYKLRKIKSIVLGSTERQFSIKNALESAVAKSSDILLVHDAVRPFASQELISSVIHSAAKYGAAIPALIPKETIKVYNSSKTNIRTLDRSSLLSAQTPQGFKRNILIDAYKNARINNLAATDDASLVEALGIPVSIVKGEETNIKLTTPIDYKLAEIILHQLNSFLL